MRQTSPIRVLFVCTGNSARSQMAEALLGALAPGEFAASSAGTEPKGVHPLTVRVLGERGIDWSAARSKGVSAFLGESFDCVVTVCDRARQSCPTFPGDHLTLHWDLEDPAEVEGSEETRLAAFRWTADEIERLIPPFIETARRSPGGRAADTHLPSEEPATGDPA